MNFWENVDTELDFQGKSRKELSAAVGFDVSTIAKGIKANSIPSADTALKVAKFLNVSIEFLLTGKDGKYNRLEANDYQKYLAYRQVITSLDNLPAKTKNLISKMIITLDEDE